MNGLWQLWVVDQTAADAGTATSMLMPKATALRPAAHLIRLMRACLAISIPFVGAIVFSAFDRQAE
jgi:hypothetical protein